MGIEIERKFLVVSDRWQQLAQPVFMRQAYISSTPGRVVRVRIEGQSAMLTLKGKSSGISRGEWEYPIPLIDAEELLSTLCEQPIIEKNRYRIDLDGLVWEVDEFVGENAGLVVAELELQSESQAFIKPDWVGEEISHDHRYANANLFKHPYSRW
ncbi:CYTH domain-containing protein [Undibacterium baiyunense]|uniref:CYTH domain-containing protein n=1 Tax=Undibacterium baiyunense TaxID=2828731 RepID=A0A941DC82_9BURK|nr:CYTH domain-containing protein [Undibacterium baiyunense]MBR7745436.1 CYTH domain-containing protein [Undibacterium baiyunense]